MRCCFGIYPKGLAFYQNGSGEDGWAGVLRCEVGATSGRNRNATHWSVACSQGSIEGAFLLDVSLGVQFPAFGRITFLSFSLICPEKNTSWTAWYENERTVPFRNVRNYTPHDTASHPEEQNIQLHRREPLYNLAR
jgi:hypothetical protein